MSILTFVILNLLAASLMVFFAWKLKNNVEEDPKFSFAMLFNREETVIAFKVLSLLSYAFGIGTTLAFLGLVFNVPVLNSLSKATSLPLIFGLAFFFFALSSITQKSGNKDEEPDKE